MSVSNDTGNLADARPGTRRGGCWSLGAGERSPGAVARADITRCQGVSDSKRYLNVSESKSYPKRRV